MALTVEDGTGVANANSYTDRATVRAYALDRGIALSVDDNIVASQLIVACDYIETFSDQFVGSPVSFTQSLSWPRKNVQFDPDNAFPSNEIPIQLIQAQCEAVIAVFQGIDLQPNVDRTQGGFIIEEKVDVLTTKYSDKVATTTQPIVTKVLSKLQSLLHPVISLRTLRV